jgi:hypothetical protein
MSTWYRIGTISLTNGQKQITGVGTDFVQNINPGFALLAPDGRLYEIDSISAAGAALLVDPYQGATIASANYAILQTTGFVQQMAVAVTDLISRYGFLLTAFDTGQLVGAGLNIKDILLSEANLPGSPAVGDAYFIGTAIYVFTGSSGWKHQSVAGVIPTGAWNANTVYAYNNLAGYGGAQYRRKTDGASASAPDADPVNWEVFVQRGAIGPAGVTPRGAWNAGTAYVLNDTATLKGSQYRRIVAGTTATSPENDAVNWELFLSKGLDGLGAVVTVNGKGPDGAGNVALVKADVGLSNADNTSDVNKPVSTAMAGELAGKVNKAGAETIDGVKTFSSIPVVGTKTQGDKSGAAASTLYVDTVTRGPAFGAYQSASQVVSGGIYTKVVFQSEEFDTDNAFDSVSLSRFKPAVPGYYQINGGVVCTSSTQILAVIYKNGAVHKFGINYQGGVTSTVSSLVYLNGTTDYLEMYVYIGAGQGLSANAQSTYFNGALVRPA